MPNGSNPNNARRETVQKQIDELRKQIDKLEACGGPRAVVVVDRGWIFAGDVSEEDGRIKLYRAVWVFRWREIGFDGMIANPNSGHVELRKLDSVVDVPADCELFRVPVCDDWGLA